LDILGNKLSIIISQMF